MSTNEVLTLDVSALRAAIVEEYDAVACEPQRGFHFHVGRPLAERLGYRSEWLDRVPAPTLDSFAGTANPFTIDQPQPGEKVVDFGSGAGMDTLIAARMVGPDGRVVGVDMTPAMVTKARASARSAGLDHVEFHLGLGEQMPVPDGWADRVISNGVFNLVPDKRAALLEMMRVLRPGGLIRVADLLLDRTPNERERARVDLWTG